MSEENAIAGTFYASWRCNPFHILIVTVKAFAKISQRLLISDCVLVASDVNSFEINKSHVSAAVSFLSHARLCPWHGAHFTVFEYGCNSNNDNNNNVNPRTTKLDWRSSRILVKVIGTLISIMGAIFVQVYRGPFIRKAASDDKLEAKINPPLFIFYSTPDRWVLGCTLLAASSLSVCVWNIIQAIFGSVIRSTVHVSCAEMKGHLYVPMFKPFGIVFATAFGSTFFTNSLHYGSGNRTRELFPQTQPALSTEPQPFGAVITGMGYYTVTWGNIREDELLRKGHNSKDAADDQKVPLLQEDSQV
ncbi:hypothetical protein WN944_020365 [Citrus x changshan-huyou]|uniref:WAT1-related protein n=1 Tax=Citrus x changshan-huyou TaxID=2935761 RepID=A0AAP0QG09_9ROSI